MFFFFFFEELYHLDTIQQAFKMVCLDKMLADGYFDMSIYINARIHKDDMYAKLKKEDSPYSILYRDPYPKPENAYRFWSDRFPNNYINENEDQRLSDIESVAIVNWVYRILKNAKERENFTKELFGQLKELHGIQRNIAYAQGVFYNKAKVELQFFSSVSGVSSFVSSLNRSSELFFRGHSNPNYLLLPSIMRNKRTQANEYKMYQELLINCPDSFEKCQTHLEKLVEMQHYGLPTRLLDITRNLLVSLFFACESSPETYGEIVLISAKESDIKYPQSDTASVLASLPVFPQSKQTEFYDWATDPSITQDDFNHLAVRLLHEVRFEKPAFQPEINKEHLIGNYVVHALKNNKRIIKQDGAFIICGLGDTVRSLSEFRYKQRGKKVVVLISNKKKILEQLDRYSINRASLFPEIECVSEYIKKKYS